MMKFCEISPAEDSAIAKIIRHNLKNHGLDIPGTAYFDDSLDHLSEFYREEGKIRFYGILKEEDRVVGGVGLAEFDFFENCCELQKLYLHDSVKGKGLGYELITFIENKARELGYSRMYLETHTNLETAIHIYEKCGYKLIEKPEGVVHATMNRFFLKTL